MDFYKQNRIQYYSDINVRTFPIIYHKMSTVPGLGLAQPVAQQNRLFSPLDSFMITMFWVLMQCGRTVSIFSWYMSLQLRKWSQYVSPNQFAQRKNANHNHYHHHRENLKSLILGVFLKSNVRSFVSVFSLHVSDKFLKHII